MLFAIRNVSTLQYPDSVVSMFKGQEQKWSTKTADITFLPLGCECQTAVAHGKTDIQPQLGRPVIVDPGLRGAGWLLRVLG